MKVNKLIPTVLAVAVASALVGCAGGGGGSSSSSPNVTTPPIDGGSGIGGGDTGTGGGDTGTGGGDTGTGGGDTGTGGGDTGTGGGDTGTGGGDTGTGGSEAPKYTYDAKNFDVSEPNTSNNKVKVGVIDTGVASVSSIEHAVEKVFAYAKGLEDGTYTVKDLTDAGIDVQDLSLTQHGTMVASVIAAKKNSDPEYSNIREGLAKDVAEIYGVSTSDTNDGLGATSFALQVMQDLQDNHGVKLFNGSFGTRDSSNGYYERLVKLAMPLADGGSLVVFSTGNNASVKPNDEALLPTYESALEKGWLAVTGLNTDKNGLYVAADGTGANACGGAARWCLAADYQVGVLYNETVKSNVNFTGTSASAPQITALAAVIWSKYPWMTADQVRQTILTTAQYIDDGKGGNGLYNSTYGWGYFDEESALNGPGSFQKLFGSESFVANIASGVAIFSNDIDGDAGLEKGGSGTLVMAGKNTYKGLTAVYDGELRVNGSISGDVSVRTTGALSGAGTVGSVTNDGVVSTENGRLTINGNYVQGAQGTLAYGLEHYLTINGAADLAGKLTVSAQNENMVTEGTHNVINAKSITGDFETVASTSAFLTVENAKKDQSNYTVDVKFKDAAKAGTLNGGLSVASGELTNKLMAKANVQSLNGESTALTDYVAKIQQASTAVQAQSVLNTNAGAIFGEAPSVLLRNDVMTSAQIAQRSYDVTKQGVTGAWVSSSYAENTTKADGWDKVDSDIKTFTAGVDGKVSDNAVVGGYVTTYSDKSTYSESNGTSETDLTTFGVYGKWNSASNLYVAGNAQYGFGDVDFKRTVTNGVDIETSSSKSDLNKFGVYGELGYTQIMEHLSVSPYAALSHNSVKLDGVKESSSVGVEVGKVTAKETKAHAGVRFDYKLSESFMVGGYGEYAYAFDRNLPTVNVASNVDNSVRVSYNAPSYDKDYFLYGLSFNYLSDNSKWNIFGDVAANALNSDDIQAQVGVKFAF